MRMLLWFGLLMTSAAVAAEPFEVTARMPDDVLRVNRRYVMTIEARLGEDYQRTGVGVAQPLLQINLPPCVELTDRELTTERELKKNNFLAAPFEMLLQERVTEIPFKLTRDPQPGETIGLNVLAYVRRRDDGAERFVRRRYEISPAKDAVATVVADNTNWRWGRGDALNIGDKLPPLELPRSDGSTFSLATLLGKQRFILTTYRAHW